jgi:CubicO group peptidase (beta-lactamase class C family)
MPVYGVGRPAGERVVDSAKEQVMGFRWMTAAVAVSAAWAAAANVHAQTASWNDSKRQQLDAYVADAMKTDGVPGMTVAVVLNGQVVYSKAFGVKQSGTAGTVQRNTQFRIASAGKQISTMLMASVVDSGAAGWDTRARDISPDFKLSDPQRTETTTLRDLVCNCTGVDRRDYELIFNGLQISPASVYADLDSLAFTQAQGTFSYSNNFVAAGGYLAAAASSGSSNDLSASYRQQLSSRVLQPVGMNRTTVSFDDVQAAGDHAQPHGLSLAYKQRVLTPDAESSLASVEPAGAHWSTADDMARFLITQINRGVAPGGVRVASAQNLEVTWTPQVAVADGIDYGLGLFTQQYLGKSLLFHGGNSSGFTSDTAFMPNDGVGVVALSNAQATLAPQAIRFRTLELLFDQPKSYDVTFKSYVLQQKALYGIVNAASLPITAPQASPYIGRYVSTDLAEVSVRYSGGKMRFDVGEFTAGLRFNGLNIAPGNGLNTVLADGPFAAQSADFATDDSGGKTMTFQTPLRSYTFVKQ